MDRMLTGIFSDEKTFIFIPSYLAIIYKRASKWGNTFKRNTNK